MKNNIKYLFIFGNIIFFVLLVIILLQNRNLKLELTKKQNQRMSLKNKCNYYESYINSTLYSEKFIEKTFPKIRLKDINSKVISTDFSSTDGCIILFFSPHTCQPCLYTHLKILQEIKSNLAGNENIPIYAISDAPYTFLKRYAISLKLDFTMVSDVEKNIFKNSYFDQTPSVFFVNKNNKIIKANISVKGMPHLSILFYKQLHHLLNLDEPVIKLKGIRFIDFISNQYDSSIISNFVL
jgi:peroxiredoxin